MQDVNSVALVGRLGRDAELKYTNSGLAITEFSIAVNNRSKKGDEWIDEPSWIECTLFGKLGEKIAERLTKGAQVMVAGRLKQESWKNKEGQNRSKIKVLVGDINVVSGESKDANIHRSNTSNSVYSDGPPHDDGFGDDDVPF